MTVTPNWARSLAQTLLVLVVGIAGFCPAQGEPAAQARWHAQWISIPGTKPQEAGVFHFRRDFNLGAKPNRFIVHVSADNRYRLFVNGVEVGNGPARGDLAHWRFETFDLAAHLHPGHNALAALVWNWGENRPAAQVSHRSAFLMQGEGEAGQLIDTGKDWKALADKAYSFQPVLPPDDGGFYVAGSGETLNAAAYPWGWEEPGFDASAWLPAEPIGGLPGEGGGARPPGTDPYGMATEWQLVPRNIPMPEQRQVRFAHLRKADGIVADESFLQGQGGISIPAHSQVTLLLDQGEMTLGHPVLVTSGGMGAVVTLTYAESLFDAAGGKGNRNAIAGKTIRGLRDHILLDGGADRRFQSLWLRAWRYVELDVQTADEPLRIRDMHSIFTAYPFQQKAAFSSDAQWLGPVWNLDWHALRLSAFETFWDTPYYEQLQYVGDTRIEALMSVYQSGDARLMRNAIEQFDASRNAEGLTASAYPSWMRQQIPSFSLWWIAMVHDYWMLRDDPEFVRRMLPGIRSVLSWYESHIDDSGMVGPMPWWNFLDWAKAYPNGTPPGGGTGRATAFTLQLALVLKQSAEMEQRLGRSPEAAHDLSLAARLIGAARARAWDAPRGLFRDAPDSMVFSQQANALAVLAGAVPAGKQRALMEKILSDPSLVQATFYFRFYVDEAMRQAGLADRYLERLGPWRTMIANGMTSTAETPEPTRSDSHAWSAHPNYHLLATVAGIRPGEAGFRSVVIAPAFGILQNLSAQMPHASGTIRVHLRRLGPQGVAGQIDLPAGLSGKFVWHGKATALHGGVNLVQCQSGCGSAPSKQR